MRIRIWNSYASNNSGSYTIVGSLPSAEVAREVAEKLSMVIDAHTAWRDGNDGPDTSPSPLADFCRTHGLNWKPGTGGHDNWPEYSEDNRPRVAAFGSQIVIHHEYTVSLPATFGEFIYKNGGRVQHEEIHAHHPIVTIATFWWGWTKEQRAQMEIELPRLIDALTADEGVLATVSPTNWPSAWRTKGEGFDDAPFTVGVIFEDLIGGAAALQEVAQKFGAKMYIRLYEAASETSDPFAHLRPSLPPPAAPRFDVVIKGSGDHRPGVVAAIRQAFGVHERDAREALMNLPFTIARSIPAGRAEAAVSALRAAGAEIELSRNDG